MINDFSISDAELLYMLNQRSACSLELIMGYYRRLVWKRAHEAMSDRSLEGVDVDDFFQEGSIGFYQSLYGFRIDKNVGLAFYINLCVGSSIKTHLRKFRTISYRLINSKNSLDLHISEDDSLTLMDTIACDQFNSCPANMATYEEINTIRMQYVASLPVLQQNIFEHHEMGFSYKEIADQLDISAKDVDNTIQKIRRRVKADYLKASNL